MRFGVADDLGHEIVSPAFCECDYAFHEGYLGVETPSGAWGVIDRNGQWIVDPQYTYIGQCGNGLLLTYDGGERTLDRTLSGGRFGYVDRSGGATIPFQFDEAYPFDDGFARVDWHEDRARMGYVAVDGKIIWKER